VVYGRQAREYGFVDTLGTMEDAVNIAAELGGIMVNPKIVKESKRKTYLKTVGDAATEVTKIRTRISNSSLYCSTDSHLPN